MNTGKIIGVVVRAVILVLSITPLVFSQHIVDDEVWFETKVILDGHTILTGSSPFEHMRSSGNIFLRFWPTANRYEHNWEIWSHEFNTGPWNSVTGIVNIYGTGDGLILRWEPTWWRLPDIVIQQASIAGFIDIQRENKTIKKARFTSTGCWVQGQTKKGWFYGDCKLIGEAIRKDSLPFPFQ